MTIKVSELRLHIDDALRADWALIGRSSPLFEAIVMDAVSTTHENHRLRRSKHVFATNRAVTFRRPFDTTMCEFDVFIHTYSTSFAVEEVLA